MSLINIVKGDITKMKPEFVKYLHADSILVLEGETKKAVLEEIITYATTRCTMDEAQLREAIWKREKMMKDKCLPEEKS